ncbi:hypothetical protein PTMSG1_06768 [Pyrenophora teres f. maculata]|nr:hypothetical protein PTMSG1_06768 [Pyrenophora teres f. maculata]
MQPILPTGSAAHHVHLNPTPDLPTRRPHTLLIAIPTPPPNSSTIISYCDPPSSPTRSYMQLHTPLTAGEVQLIASCADFGFVRIPASENVRLANFLHRQMELLETSSQDAQMASKLVAHLHSLNADAGFESGGSEGVEVNILSITVLGDKSETDDLIPPNCRLLWKWAKPQSEYRKTGFWSHSLTQVFVNAEWNAGNSVVVLVKAVEEDEYERVVRGEMKT